MEDQILAGDRQTERQMVAGDRRQTNGWTNRATKAKAKRFQSNEQTSFRQYPVRRTAREQTKDIDKSRATPPLFAHVLIICAAHRLAEDRAQSSEILGNSIAGADVG